MRKFLLRLLVCSSLVCLVFSCKTYNLTNVTEINSDKMEFENLFFSTSEDYLYRCQIDIYNNHLSGILIIKQISENIYRIALTTDFGNKLIDFEISENSFKVNYIIPDMDKKFVKNFLKNDFSILLKRHFAIIKELASEKQNIYLSKNEKKSFYWFVNQSDLLPVKMIFTENGKEKINFFYDSKTPIFANEILIKHKDYNISFTLKKLEE